MRRIIIAFILLLTAGGAWAQYPLAAGSPHGVYIFLTNRIPKDGYIQVARSGDKKGGENLIATVETPKNQDDLANRIQKVEPLFIDLGHYTDQDISRMWDFIQANTLLDTLPPVNYPVMLLAAGTAYLDQTAKPGIKYTYTITYYRGGSIADTKKTNTVTLPPVVNLPVPEYHSVNADRQKVYIDWLVKEDPYLYSFRVYRRKNMAGEFEKINPERGFYNQGDSLFLVMTDRDISPRTVYEYYAEPLDRLDNPGKACDPVVVSDFMHSDIPVLKQFNVSQGDGDHTVRLYWKFDNPDLVRSIGIFRSEVYDSAYQKIAEVPASDSVYTDHVTDAMENYYYYLVFQGIMNKSFPSAKVGGHSVNLAQPDPPADVAAEPVKGGVKVYWKHENPVVAGYYIYRDQGVNDTLQQLSGLIKANGEMMSYTDTSATLQGNHTYRYAVVAVNDGYRLSSPSEVVAVRPSITTRVLAPSDLHGGYLDGKVILVWDDMNPQDEYLAGYNVYRKGAGEGSYMKINRDLVLFNDNTFTDSTAGGGRKYDYTVTSLDESGSESPYSTALDVVIPGGEELPVPVYDVRISKGTASVFLTWPPESAANSDKFRIYRYEAGQKASRIAEVPGDTFKYEDKSVSKGHLYFYYLTVVTNSGKESGQGNVVSIRY